MHATGAHLEKSFPPPTTTRGCRPAAHQIGCKAVFAMFQVGVTVTSSVSANADYNLQITTNIEETIQGFGERNVDARRASVGVSDHFASL